MTNAQPLAGRSNYDQRPSVRLPAGDGILVGDDVWEAIVSVSASRAGQPRVALDLYPGSDTPWLRRHIAQAFAGWRIVDVENAALSPEDYATLTASTLTDDRVFGVMSHFRLRDFYRADALERLREEIADTDEPIVVIGWGAALAVSEDATIVLVDMARWEIQRRQRAGAPSWRTDDAHEDPLRKVKRGYFLEWRVGDRHKSELFDRVDYVLDANDEDGAVKAITGATFRAAMKRTVSQPFRVVPFFDPGVWGGQWMRQTFGLDREAPNYAWCFDCVPEENSILLSDGTTEIELPSLDVVLTEPRRLLGEKTFARFGAEFPIRFDFLDTLGGGNLSLQVHPLTEYIRDRFGMTYTQDESYYMLEAADDATVYLGIKDGVEPAEMIADLRAAALGEMDFPADDYINRFPARKHDHFLIPAGTVHCSGADAVVLEISATPYLFTFKMWDWGRVGLDGKPRPIHLDHAVNNVQWDRTTEWVERELVNHVEPIAEGEGWQEERTGLHELEFIEVRRHWFTAPVPHDTRGTVNVINLVEGDEVEVSSPSGAFEPLRIHFAETFIVPADVGEYVITPVGESDARFATLTASVRGSEMA